MQLGALVPFTDTGGDPPWCATTRRLEAMGYDFLEAPDHVLGANAASRHRRRRTIADDMFHDPFVLLGFLAGFTTKLEFSTGVLILPQRQTALVAKQAAWLDVLCGGRFRLGIGVGWNPVEFTRPEREFSQSRPALRGAGAGDAGAVGAATCHVQGPLSHDRRCRHQSAAGLRPRAALVWRPPRAHAAAHREVGRRLDAERLSADQSALDIFGELRRLTEQARPRSGIGRHRGLDVLWRRHRG